MDSTQLQERKMRTIHVLEMVICFIIEHFLNVTSMCS